MDDETRKKIEAFLKDLEAIYRKHNMEVALASYGDLVIQTFSEDAIEYLREVDYRD